MRQIINCSLILLAVFAVFWLSAHHETLLQELSGNPGWYVAAIFGFYLLSHLFRVMRLAILALERREFILPIAAAHALTAFPASIFPFKIGEILRLASFFIVCDNGRKALAIWLVERFLDVVVLCSLIIALYLADVEVSETLKIVFIVFFVAGSSAVLAFFAVAKMFIFINQFLVLSSHTKRGLLLLKISHALRQVELEIHRSITGRLSGLLLLSAAIWLTEILVIFTVLGADSFDPENISGNFVMALSGIIFGDLREFSGVYFLCQALVLMVLAVFCAATIIFSRTFRGLKN